MTTVAQTLPSEFVPFEGRPPAAAPNDASVAPQALPDGWNELRGSSDIQFEPVQPLPPPPPEPPPEPGWFEEMLKSLFEGLGDLLSPIGQFIGISWPILQWVLLALVVLLVLYFILRMVGPLQRKGGNVKDKSATSVPEWRPDEEESVALLGDADQLAAEGRYDEATHLLLVRSVIQISEARPDWVEPSSTARELAALPALSNAARTAFGVMSERVERSLFALRALDRSDWDAARKAYADFALARIEGPADPEAEAERARGFGRKAIA